MPITNIEYGSLASSETLNNNFSYLDEKITTTSTSINTSLSSLSANIATLNTNLSNLASNIDSRITTLDQKVETYRTKIKSLISKANMLPNWRGCNKITFTSGHTYKAAANGYVLILPDSAGSGTLTINGESVNFKLRGNAYDNASELTVIPVQVNDTMSTTLTIKHAYFVPIASVSVSGF